MRAAHRPDLVLTARRAQARGLPASLPVAEVEAIPFFGTSWYTRGVSYYLRRVLASLLLLIALAVAVTFDVGIVQGFDDGSSSGEKLAWRLVLGVLFLASFISPLRNLRREQERRRAGEIVYPQYRPGLRRPSTGGAAMGSLARAGSTLAGAFLAVASVVFLGWFVIFFLGTFRQEYGVEHDARLRLQRRQTWPASKRPAPRAR